MRYQNIHPEVYLQQNGKKGAAKNRKRAEEDDEAPQRAMFELRFAKQRIVQFGPKTGFWLLTQLKNELILL